MLANCEEVDLILGEVLVEPGDLMRHVHFPTGGSFISMITPVDGASALEVGLVGHEGMHGVSLALGVDVALVHARVQGGGRALRMSAAAFKRELRHSPALRRRMNHYLYVLMGQLAQSSLCTRYHVIEARLARWLLMTRDRAHSDQFQITQRFLGWMLGVRCSGITCAANNLQKRALITY
ncbi:MAG: Crp/Fnr family transcriptional regulator, partial [Casimicrobiaceae bacterium]